MSSHIFRIIVKSVFVLVFRTILKIEFHKNMETHTEIIIIKREFFVRQLGRIRLATDSRPGSLALVNKLHAGNIIQQSSLDS
ncbi:hypothetical protein ACO2IF_13915, partial [Leptospira kirschneri]